jgi:hypothetical protein
VVLAVIVAVAVFGRSARDTNSVVSAPSSTVAVSSTVSSATTSSRGPVAERCITVGVSTKVTGTLHATLVPDRSCAAPGGVRLQVTNSGSTTCTSDQVAMFGQQRMHFVSQSGYGGAHGYWEAAPASEVDSTGVIEYPVGRRSWPLTVPTSNEPWGVDFTIEATCGGTTQQVRMSILSAPNFPHSDGTTQLTNVFDGVKYYGVCGNEVLQFKGYALYPLLPAQAIALPVANYVLPGPPPTTSATSSSTSTSMTATTISKHSLLRPMVPAPGPGDDVGRLALYADGVARFESQRGRVVWLTTAQQSYDWKC